MLILKKGHQPGVYVPLRALFLVASASGHFLKLFYLLTITVQGYAYCLLSSPELKAHR